MPSRSCSRLQAWCGVVGPTGFVAAWVIAGARAKGYSPANDAISRLAAADAPTRWLMTAGFVCFGIGVPVFSLVLRHALPGPTWVAAAVSGFATLGVAASPIHVTPRLSQVHGVFASIGYIALALVPLLAAPALRRQDHHRAAAASMVVAALAGACLVATSVAEANGLFQRLGLTVVDAWLVVSAIALAPAATRENPAR
jgi:hypothetical membrane protein